MQYSRRVIDTEVTTRIGTEFEYTDPSGLLTANQFEAKVTVHADGKYVPFHAIDVFKRTDTIEQKEKPNPYGCENGDGGSKACDSKACSAKVAC